MPIAKVRGLALHYEVKGSGEPLVVLMGQSTGPAGRNGLIKSLAQHYTVITHDQRGTGRVYRNNLIFLSYLNRDYFDYRRFNVVFC